MVCKIPEEQPLNKTCPFIIPLKTSNKKYCTARNKSKPMHLVTEHNMLKQIKPLIQQQFGLKINQSFQRTSTDRPRDLRQTKTSRENIRKSRITILKKDELQKLSPVQNIS